MTWMDGARRSSRAMETGGAPWPGNTFFAAAALFLSLSAQQAHAQVFVPPPPPPPRFAPPPPPPPPPPPSPSIPASDLSSGAAITNLGSNFLERLGEQASD